MEIEIIYGVEADSNEVKDCLSKADFLRRNGYRAIFPAGVKLGDEFNDDVVKKIEQEHKNNTKRYEEKKKELSDFWANRGKEISKYFKNFRYPAPETVKVFLTAYGTGGTSFLPNMVWIRLDLSEYEIKSEEALIHEIIHLCIEKPVVQKYDLNQMEKEKVVDYFFNLPGLKEMFPDYAQAKYGNPSEELLERIGWNK